MHYDQAGNRTGDFYYEASDDYSPTFVRQRHHYDAMNRLILTTHDDDYVVDRRLYDKASRLIQSGTGEGVGWSSAYRSDIPAMTEADIKALDLRFDDKFSASTKVTVYDTLGRMSNQFSLGANGRATDQVLFQNYDGVGNLLRYSVASGRSDTPVQWFDQYYQRFDGYALVEVRGDGEDHGFGQTSLQYDANGFTLHPTFRPIDSRPAATPTAPATPPGRPPRRAPPCR